MTKTKYYSNIASALYKRECAYMDYYDNLNNYYHCNFLNREYKNLMDAVYRIRLRVGNAYVKAIDLSESE